MNNERYIGLGVMRSALCTLVALLPQVTQAQGEISGRVLSADGARPPVQGAEASIARLRLAVLSDSAGRFRLKDLPAGAYLVVLRAIGFNAESSLMTVDVDEVLSWDVVLKRSIGTVLPERVVTESRSPAHLVEFNERRSAGVGHFITRDQLEKAEGGKRQTGDVISQVPGVTVRRGSNKVWVASGRNPRTTQCAFCDKHLDSTGAPLVNRADFAAGARPACFMDVYLDGALIFDSRYPGNGLFDVNTVSPEHIAGIEVYSSPSQVPAKYNRTGGECGVLLVWTR